MEEEVGEKKDLNANVGKDSKRREVYGRCGYRKNMRRSRFSGMEL